MHCVPCPWCELLLLAAAHSGHFLVPEASMHLHPRSDWVIHARLTS